MSCTGYCSYKKMLDRPSNDYNLVDKRFICSFRTTKYRMLSLHTLIYDKEGNARREVQVKSPDARDCTDSCDDIYKQ